MRPVTAAQMRRIDERAAKEYGIPSLLLMENAGAACAREALRLGGHKLGKVVILCGKGNNGGDGFVAARHLMNKGLRPSVFFFQNPSEMKPDPLVNFHILQKMKADLRNFSKKVSLGELQNSLRNSDLIVDALFGTGISRLLDELFRTVVALVNASKRPVVSVDIPSGLNADTGEVMGVCIRANLTVALGLPKKGFYQRGAKRWTGKVIVADISIPPVLLK